MKCLKASVLPEKSWRNNNNQVIVSFLFYNGFRKVVLFIFIVCSCQRYNYLRKRVEMCSNNNQTQSQPHKQKLCMLNKRKVQQNNCKMFFVESLFPRAVGLEYTHRDSMKIGLPYFGPKDEFEEPIGGWHNMLSRYMMVYGLT